MYAFRGTHGPVELAFTDRLGGVSAAPFDELDLSQSDRPDTVVNLRAVLDDFAPGAAIAQMRQVHGAVVDEPGSRTSEDLPEADAMVTSQGDQVLVVRAADCVPVILVEQFAGLIAVAHAGRPGVEQGVVTRTLETLARLGATQVHAWVGPHVCGGCYEVPPDLQERVAAVEPATRATTTWGSPSLDIGAGVRAQLERGGAVVHDVSRCTRESADLYSYRRDGAGAGRLAGLVVLR